MRLLTLELIDGGHYRFLVLALNSPNYSISLWGADYVAGSNIVDRHVRNLRLKLKDDWRNPRFIGTVPGKGYRFLATG